MATNTSDDPLTNVTFAKSVNDIKGLSVKLGFHSNARNARLRYVRCVKKQSILSLRFLAQGPLASVA